MIFFAYKNENWIAASTFCSACKRLFFGLLVRNLSNLAFAKWFEKQCI